MSSLLPSASATRTLAALALLAAAAAASGSVASAQDAPPQDAPSFAREILPLLKEHCAGCHRPGKTKGGLDLTTHAAVLAGLRDEDADGGNGPTYPVVVSGDPGASLLVEVVVSQDGEPPAMPGEGDPLSAAQVRLLERWIEAGMPDDSAGTGSAPRPEAPRTYPRPPVQAAVVWARDPRPDAAPTSTLVAVPGRREVLVHALDADGGSTLLHRLALDALRVEALALSPDGTRLAACGGSPARFGEVRIWDLATGAEIASARSTEDCLYGISWSPDGRAVAFGSTDTAVRTLDAATGEPILYQGAHDDWVLDTCWSTDGSHLVTVGRDRSMKLTKVATEQFIDNITSITPGALKGGLIAVARHPSRDELLVAGADGTPSVFRMYRQKKRVIGDDYNRLHTLESMPGRVFGLCWSARGTEAYAVSSDGAHGVLRAFSIPDPVVETKSEGGAEAESTKRPEPRTLWTTTVEVPLYGLALSPDQRLVAAVGRDGTVRTFDAATGEAGRRMASVPMAPPPEDPPPTRAERSAPDDALSTAEPQRSPSRPDGATGGNR